MQTAIIVIGEREQMGMLHRNGGRIPSVLPQEEVGGDAFEIRKALLLSNYSVVRLRKPNVVLVGVSEVGVSEATLEVAMRLAGVTPVDPKS